MLIKKRKVFLINLFYIINELNILKYFKIILIILYENQS